jgi:molybdopterin-guanine dinucleotide biosynthesis protein A
MGGAKATVMLKGRPLIWYPLGALSAALNDVVVLAKADSELPSLPATTVWIEADDRHHPAIGIAQALDLAGGRAILVCASDLPFVTPALIRELATLDPNGAPAVIARTGGAMQPLLGCYQPSAARCLRPGDDRSLREQVEALGPRMLDVEDPDELFNVNAPEDLLQAAAMLDRQRTANRR